MTAPSPALGIDTTVGRMTTTDEEKFGDRRDLPSSRQGSIGPIARRHDVHRLLIVQAAFFDLDKTVIARASLVAFGGPFRRAGMIGRSVMLRTAWNGLLFHTFGADEERMRKFRESALRVTRGWDQRAVRTLVGETLTEVIDPIVYDEALDLIDDHRAAGHRVVIVSASPIEIVEPLARHLGADDAIASRARLDERGHYTGEVDFYAYGPEKATAITDYAARHDIDLTESHAYSDSATDEPMLRSVGHPVAVNPDRALARLAESEGWPVLEFSHPIALRDRIPLPTPGIALTAAAIGGSVATGVAVGWWLTHRTREGSPTRFRRPGAS